MISRRKLLGVAGMCGPAILLPASARARVLRGSTVAAPPESPFNLVLNYHSSTDGAGQPFKDAMQFAANLIMAAIQDPITVTLQIGVDNANGFPHSANANSSGADNGLTTVNKTFSQIRTALASKATSGDDNTFVSYLNSLSSTYNGFTNWQLAAATQKVLGFLPANQAGVDGWIDIGSLVPSTSWVNVALHEMTHAMGRLDNYAPFDFTRFTAVGTPRTGSLKPTPACYFAIDGGVTRLADYDQSSDLSDFKNGGVQDGANPDSFDAFYADGSSLQILTAVDKRLMDVLGFTVQ